jgi:hypothetical protein
MILQKKSLILGKVNKDYQIKKLNILLDYEQ